MSGHHKRDVSMPSCTQHDPSARNFNGVSLYLKLVLRSVEAVFAKTMSPTAINMSPRCYEVYE